MSLCVGMWESGRGVVYCREEVELEGISHSAGFLFNTARWLLLAFLFVLGGGAST